jgi:hypothetical protein
MEKTIARSSDSKAADQLMAMSDMQMPSCLSATDQNSGAISEFAESCGCCMSRAELPLATFSVARPKRTASALPDLNRIISFQKSFAAQPSSLKEISPPRSLNRRRALINVFLI